MLLVLQKQGSQNGNDKKRRGPTRKSRYEGGKNRQMDKTRAGKITWERTGRKKGTTENLGARALNQLGV